MTSATVHQPPLDATAPPAKAAAPAEAAALPTAAAASAEIVAAAARPSACATRARLFADGASLSADCRIARPTGGSDGSSRRRVMWFDSAIVLVHGLSAGDRAREDLARPAQP